MYMHLEYYYYYNYCDVAKLSSQHKITACNAHIGMYIMMHILIIICANASLVHTFIDFYVPFHADDLIPMHAPQSITRTAAQVFTCIYELNIRMHTQMVEEMRLKFSVNYIDGV